MFIGPTSQAPRVDEARNDQLYELEIALREIERNRERYGHRHAALAGGPHAAQHPGGRHRQHPPQRVLHRQAVLARQLHRPPGPAGAARLRDAAARAHEHRAAAAAARAGGPLLEGALPRALVRWGTELHDRFLLPTFVKMDFADVLAEMREAGFAFDDAWFAPHFEFRFPLVGEVQARGIELTLRNALEPWHVMGEEGSPGGTVRYVDSSLERIEVRVTGLNESRYVITCNGRAAAAAAHRHCGRIRGRRALQGLEPAVALHPSIGVHAPLTFDIVDTWMKRSLGGCQYHVAHPGGRNYDTFPVNAYEAESRRCRASSAWATPRAS
jgi:uncharacterized protein (DUF2126 family)